MTTSSQSFVSTMLDAFILLMFLPLIALQCMDYRQMYKCSSRVYVDKKDLLERIDECLVKKMATQCYAPTEEIFSPKKDNCANFKKTTCNNIPGDESLEEDLGAVFKGGKQITFVDSLEECKTVCAIGSTCRAFTWFKDRRRCLIHSQSRDRSPDTLRQGDYQAIKNELRSNGRCVVLNLVKNYKRGIKVKGISSLKGCVETVLNTSTIRQVDWNFDERTCWSYDFSGKESYHREPLPRVQLRKHKRCKLWQKAVPLQKHENTKMSGGLKLKGLSKPVCLELCQLVSNCAAVGWSDILSECTIHLFNLSTKEDSSSTLYTTGGAGITTSTTTAATSTEITTISTSTESTTTAPIDGIGTFLWAFFIRRDNNLLTSKSHHRAALECAMLCFPRNCSDFTSTILNKDSVCGMSGSEPTGRSLKMQWIKL